MSVEEVYQSLNSTAKTQQSKTEGAHVKYLLCYMSKCNIWLAGEKDIEIQPGFEPGSSEF